MTRFWPRFSRSGVENSVAPIDYLEWYIPRLQEARKHNLSFSGMQYDWNFNELLGDSIGEIGKTHLGQVEDPRIIIARRENVEPENVLITHGATQGINISLLTAIAMIRDTVEDKITVAVESPTYAPIPQSALLLADEVIKIDKLPPSDGRGEWRIDYDKWHSAMQQSQIIMITPISNPCGWNLHPEDKNWIMEQASINDVIVIADEAYNDAYRGFEDYQAIHSFGQNCISINSLTKVYAMGPIRFGWIISDKNTIAIARRIFMTFSGVMASPTIRIGAEALKRLDLVDKAIQHYRKENLPRLRLVLEKYGIIWNEPPAGVFGCFELPNGLNSETFADHHCKEYDLLVVPGSMFSEDLKSWVRVAWSIEPNQFVHALNALDKSLNYALNTKQVNKSN